MDLAVANKTKATFLHAYNFDKAVGKNSRCCTGAPEFPFQSRTSVF
jgi:hypothetical protein